MHTLLTQIIDIYTTQHAQSKSTYTFSKSKASRTTRLIHELASSFKILDTIVQNAGKFDVLDDKMLKAARVCADFIQIMNDLLPHPSVTVTVALKFSRYLTMEHNDLPTPIYEPRSPRIGHFTMKPMANLSAPAQDNHDDEAISDGYWARLELLA